MAGAFLGLYLWMGYATFQILLACWRPTRATAPWVILVHNHNDRFFPVFKWLSPLCVVQFAFGAVAMAAECVIAIIRSVVG
jgi:hypothetical protein